MISLMLVFLCGIAVMLAGFWRPKLVPWLTVGFVAASGPLLFIYDNWIATQVGAHVSSTNGIAFVVMPIALLVSCGIGAFLAFGIRRLRAI